MIIQIKENENVKEESKYKMILQKNPDLTIKYDWNLTGEYENESIEDFHLFCLSIVKDILDQNFKTNKNDKNNDYNLDDVDIDYLNQELSYIYRKIATKKIGKLK